MENRTVGASRLANILTRARAKLDHLTPADIERAGTAPLTFMEAVRQRDAGLATDADVLAAARRDWPRVAPAYVRAALQQYDSRRALLTQVRP